MSANSERISIGCRMALLKANVDRVKSDIDKLKAQYQDILAKYGNHFKCALNKHNKLFEDKNGHFQASSASYKRGDHRSASIHAQIGHELQQMIDEIAIDIQRLKILAERISEQEVEYEIIHAKYVQCKWQYEFASDTSVEVPSIADLRDGPNVATLSRSKAGAISIS